MVKLICRLLLPLWLLCYACSTEVELCYEPLHPHHTLLDFRFQWDDEYAGTIPDSMRVTAIRWSNIVRYDYQVTSGASDNKGTLLYPADEAVDLTGQKNIAPMTRNGETGDSEVTDEENGGNEETDSGNGENTGSDEGNGNDEATPGEETPDENTPSAAMPQHKLWARAGDYNILTYAWDSNVFEDAIEEDVNNIVTGENGEGLYSEINLVYKHHPASSPYIKSYAGTWTDYNPYADYILGYFAPIYSDVVDLIEVPLSNSGSPQTVTVNFHPTPVTQRLTFTFDVDKAEGVVIDSMIAEVSGVPARMELNTGYVDADKTYKVLFKPNYDNAGYTTKADSMAAAVIRCTGVVQVIGIIQSYNPEWSTGPGVMHLAIYTHTEDDEGAQRTKLHRVCINLYNTLEQAGLMEWDKDKKKYKQAVKEAILPIEAVLEVKKDQAAGGEEDTESGIDNWETAGRIDL